MKKLKYIVSVQKGKVPKEMTISNTDDLPIYLSMDYLRGEPKQISYVPNSEKYILVDDNEILLLWDGANAGEFMWSKKGVLSSTMAVITPNNDINKQFLFYRFKDFERYLKDITIGMGIPHVNPQEFLNFSFFIPPPPEQTTIANYLDSKTDEIDQLITQKERLLELYEEEKTAIINQAVTKGINPDVKFKDSGIDWLGEIPEHWEVKRVATLGTFSKGKGIPRSELKESGCPAILYGDIYTKYNIKADFIFNHISEETAQYSIKIQFGDLLFTGSGETIEDIGKCITYIGNEIVYAGGDVIILKQKIYNSLFLSYSLNSNIGIFQKARMAKGQIIVHIYSSNLREILIPLPQLKEQTQIVQHIETETARINAKAEKTKRLIELLKEYKTALISEVVTGKVRVM